MTGLLQVLTRPGTRRWLYGVAAASLPGLVGLGWLPAQALPYMLPFLVALFYVNPK